MLWPAVVVLVMATACGGSGDDGDGDQGAGTSASVDGTDSTSAGPGGAATTAPDGEPAAQASVLRRRDTRPGDVAAQADYFTGGPPPHNGCLFESVPASDGPTVVVDPAMVVGEATVICLFNFTPGTTVRVQVTRPDDEVEIDQVRVTEPDPDSDFQPANSVFNTIAGDPTGTYDVAASAGTLRATGTFEVDFATNPNVVVAESPGRGVASSPRGTPIHIGLAGWPPGERVELAIYHSPSVDPDGRDEETFLTLLPVVVDGDGQRLHVLETQPDDPVGCYIVNPRPLIEMQDLLGRGGGSIVQFCLT